MNENESQIPPTPEPGTAPTDANIEAVADKRIATRVYHPAIKAQIAQNGGKAGGWGVNNSLAVIEALWENETGDKPRPFISALIKSVINPSQFRQSLEAAKLLDETSSGKRGARFNPLAGLE